jgi:hypothetical protein
MAKKNAIAISGVLAISIAELLQLGGLLTGALLFNIADIK